MLLSKEIIGLLPPPVPELHHDMQHGEDGDCVAHRGRQPDPEAAVPQRLVATAVTVLLVAAAVVGVLGPAMEGDEGGQSADVVVTGEEDGGQKREHDGHTPGIR